MSWLPLNLIGGANTKTGGSSTTYQPNYNFKVDPQDNFFTTGVTTEYAERGQLSDNYSGLSFCGDKAITREIGGATIGGNFNKVM